MAFPSQNTCKSNPCSFFFNKPKTDFFFIDQSIINNINDLLENPLLIPTHRAHLREMIPVYQRARGNSYPIIRQNPPARTQLPAQTQQPRYPAPTPPSIPLAKVPIIPQILPQYVPQNTYGHQPSNISSSQTVTFDDLLISHPESGASSTARDQLDSAIIRATQAALAERQRDGHNPAPRTSSSKFF